MNELYVKLSEIFEEDEIKSEQVLEEFEEWDSLTVLSIIAMIDSSYNATLSADELREFKTIGDLEGYIESHMEK